MKKVLLFFCALIIITMIVLFLIGGRIAFAPNASTLLHGIGVKQVTSGPIVRRSTITDPFQELEDVMVVAQELSVPWGIAFLPQGELLVSERTGDLVHFTAEAVEKNRITLENTKKRGESGLLGIATHPNFAENKWLYIYETFEDDGGIKNRVVRYAYNGFTLTDEKIIITDIAGAPYHDGGRIAFGPDDLLYITTGDATAPETAQDRNSLSGKILRIHDDGRIPEDNPFSTAVYSYGHRNPQGLAWDNRKNLWSTEHGRSGSKTGFDELNFIIPGGNYGWPHSEGPTVNTGTVAPAAHSGPTETWAPASVAYWDGSMWFGGLRGQSIYEAQIDGDTVTEVIVHFREDFGRIRTVMMGPDGRMYITTSNTDGRAAARHNDDKIISINPQIFR